MSPVLGFLGVGRMGLPMVLRLLDAGHPVHVWNLTPEPLALPVARGAVACASPAEVARRADVVLSCLLDAKAVEQVVFGPEGVASAPGAGKLLVDHASIPPATTTALAARLQATSGMGWVDAPISGGVAKAEAGALAIFCGAEPQSFERVRPLLACYASNLTHVGPVGAGQTMKLCNQVLVGSAMCAIAEAVRLAQQSGLDAALLPRALAGGAADSMLLQLLAPRMVEPPQDSLGASNMILKDLDTALELARSTNTPLPLTATASQLFRMLSSRGRGEQEPSHLIELYRP
jgi:3-hydroxyisobutyrate dehydrogenase